MSSASTLTTRVVPVCIGLGVLAIAAILYFGSQSLSGDAGYAGVSAHFLPLTLAGLLALCGLWIIVQALTTGLPKLDAELLAVSPSWAAFSYLSVGLLLNALLIGQLGFILSCALCYALAVRGLRAGQGRAGGSLRLSVRDFAIGIAISAPVFWLFSKVLNVSLPSLTLLASWGIDSQGWL